MKKFIIFLTVAIAYAATMNAAPEWRQTNGPFGGYMKKVVENSKGDLFALSEVWQLFKKAAGSDTWTMIGDGYNEVTVDAKDNILVGVSYGDILLYDQNMNFVKIIQKNYDFDHMRSIVATNTGGIYAVYPYGGIYFSSDEGENWNTLNVDYPYKVKADSGNVAIVLNHGKEYLRTSDNGQSFDYKVINSSNTAAPIDMEYNYTFNTWIVLGTDSCIYVSRDSAMTWTKVKEQVNTYDYIAMHASKEGNTYIYCEDKSYVSTDGGDSWSTLDGFDSLGLTSFIEYNGELVFTARKGIYKYNLNSKEISDFNNGLIASIINKVAVDKDGVVYAAANNGLFRSTDEGANWSPIMTIDSGDAISFDNVFCSKSGLLFANTLYDSWMSSDKGNSWSPLKYQADTAFFSINVLAEDDFGRLYGDGLGLSYSDDDAQTWDTMQVQGKSYGYKATVAAYKNRLALGTYQDGVFYSTNRGETFRKLPMDVPENYGSYCLFNSKGDFFVAMNAWQGGDAIFRSTDGCISFEDLPLVNYGVRFIAVDSSDYLYTHNTKYRLIRSTDNGETWEEASDTSDARLSVTDICFGSKNNAYMGTAYNGVFKTDEVKSAREPRACNEPRLLISPNPAAERATISLAEDISPADITIYNQLGEIVYRTQHRGENGEIVIPVAEFPQGAYFVKVSAGGEVMTGKFAVVR